ncbi:P-type conjugative transfer protein TrbJ [Shewanella sp.]|uniref:P-type conjugative transfer protein TrbJ n=1 Tax=Shewanella sp. TaxID=50422 RepID=UPI003D0A9258
MKCNVMVLTAILMVGANYIPQSKAFAFVCANCGTEWTQLLNQVQLVNQYAEQVRHTVNQVKMIQDQLQNTKALVSGEWGNTFDQINKLSDLARQGQSIAFSATNLTNEMNQRYKGYNNWQRTISNQEYEDHYRKLSQSMGDSAGSALSVANGIYNQRHEDELTLNRIESRSSSAAGRMEAIQAGNELSAQIIRQLQKIETLMSAQIQMTSAFIQTENEKTQIEKAQAAEFKKGEAPALRSRQLETYQLKPMGQH